MLTKEAIIAVRCGYSFGIAVGISGTMVTSNYNIKKIYNILKKN